MKHNIDLDKYSLRTDLINETIENNKSKIDSKIDEFDNIKVTSIYLDKENSHLLNKKVGDYITIEFDDITDYENKEKVKNIFIKYLNKIITKTKIKEKQSCLVIGLGNSKSTPDALGPLTIENIVVTNHIFMYDEPNEGFRPVSAFIPGVTGTTGIETSDMIKSVVKSLKPDFLIVIDALASQSLSRVNKTIQITNTGIHPGSGVGNSRKEISYETIKIPVIAIGVPTVVDATVIVSDTINYMQKHYAFNKDFQKNPMSKLVNSSNINYLKKEITIKEEDRKKLLGIIGTLNEYEVRQLIYEVLNPIGYNLMVTPKEVDFVIEKLADIIGNGINRTLHKSINNI